MKTNIYTLIAMLLLSPVVQIPEVAAQTTAGPMDESLSAKTAGAQQHRRGPKRFLLKNGDGAKIDLWKPDLSTLPLTAEHGSLTLPRTGVDNYHALVVEKDWGYLKEALIRYQYMHGKPSGHSTRELTAAEKTTFEIVPEPVPREHQHYRSGQSWNFLLRYRGAPAAHVPVSLETSNGTELSSVSDRNGIVSLRIPDDFSLLEAGERDRRSAEFTVSAETEDAGVVYQTRLSAEYRVNPSRWQSLELGMYVTGVGLLAGGFLGRKAAGHA